MLRKPGLLLIAVLLVSADGRAADWKPVPGHIMTRWADQVGPDDVWQKYPRPQMVRPRWVNLNGLWELAITGKDASRPQKFDRQILVPFPVESALSGIKQPVKPEQAVWYRRGFRVPEGWKGQRLLLHFEAVDWYTQVWVNGSRVGEHKGGYDPFWFDITECVDYDGENELVVRVWDPTDRGYQPRGKQVLEPHGIWYTAVTGIWQTVWLEPVPRSFIRGFRIYPSIDPPEATFVVHGVDVPAGTKTRVNVHSRSLREQVQKITPVVASGNVGEPVSVAIPHARLWSPDEPYLYWATVELVTPEGEVLDSVETYFGLREIAVRKDVDGYNRLFLNGKALFHYGPLDQGWWPDGLYTAPTDEALRFDIEVMKKFRFNAVRKHVKVEPRRWYFWCDTLGLMVWQDMPSGDRFVRRGQPDIVRTPESAENFWREYRAMIDTHFNNPCIVMWVPFNEGWGQFETEKVTRWTMEYDPTRLVNNASGWQDRGVGHVVDMHRYPGPGMPEPEERRAAVLGEFGGLGLPVPGHLWWDKRNWGYRTYKTREELEQAYLQLMAQLKPLIARGLAAAIYTQLTDVEGEVNGLMTYDREVIKFDIEKLAKVHESLYEPPPIIKRTVLLPTAESSPQEWRYTLNQPPATWFRPEFDDSAWKTGVAGFGREGTPGAIVRTPWTTSDIWLRRVFTVGDIPPGFVTLRIHHDEDAEVYLNGQLIATLEGYTTSYVEYRIPNQELVRSALRPGRNVLAVHCRQTGGGQYIDVGLVVEEEKPRPQ